MPRLVILPDGRAVYAPDEMTRDQVLAASGFAAPAAPEPDVRDDEQKSDIIDDIQRGLGGLLAGTGSAIRDINEGAGRWLQERGNEIVAANPADYGSLSDISGIGDLVGFGIERLAETAPQLVGAGIASAVGSPLAGAAILAAPTGVSTYGEARQAQRDTGQESYLRAAAAGVGAGALDLLGVGRVLPGNVASKLLGDVVEGGIRGTVKSGLKVGGEEALTETGQQVLQRFGGMQELTSPEAMEEYAFSALAGGLVGGGLGAGAGAVRSFTSPTEAAPIEDVGTQGFRATAAPQVEVPPEIASAAPLATIDIPDIEAPEPGAVRKMAVLSQPDEGGRVWVRTPEGVTTQMPEVLLSQIGGTYTPFTEPTAGVVPGETVGTGTTTFTVNGVPVTTSGSLQPTMPVALPIGEPVDVTAPVNVATPAEVPAPIEAPAPVEISAPVEAPAPVETPVPVAAAAPVAHGADASSTLEAALRARIAAFDGRVSLHARNLDTGAEVGIAPDERVRTASTIKLPIACAVADLVADGKARWDERLTVTAQTKVSGSGVLSEFTDGETVTLRDAMALMIVVSDNTATNLILDRIGADAVNDYLDRLGLTATRSMRKIRGDGTQLKAASGWSRAGLMPENQRFGIGSSTPREMTQLLAALAAGQVVDEATSRDLLGILERQQYKDGIGRRTGGLRVASKSGSLDALRSDVGLVWAPQGRIAVAITVDGMPTIDYSPDNVGDRLISDLAQRIIADLR